MSRNKGKHAPYQIAEITDRIANMRGYAEHGDIQAIQREYAEATLRMMENYNHWMLVAKEKLLSELED